MIYLASPYSDPNPAVMEARFEAACRAAGKLMNEGHVVYSPIVHCHPIAVRCGLPRDWTYWERFDREMLERASVMYVLKIDGWLESKGIANETKLADDLDVPVIGIDP
jgi:hypothetical protein